ncbi:MAG: M16 family metallopeptidase [Myxococcales bacterium]
MAEIPEPSTPAALAQLTLPKLHERRLPNGMLVAVAERRQIPLVAINLVFRSGAAREEPRKAGLADFVVELLRRGTEKFSAEDIDERLELMGADLRLETGNDSTYVASTAPSEHLPPVLETIAEIVQRPTFPAREVEQARKRTLGRIQTELDNPSSLAGDAISRLAFGRHPYGLPAHGTLASVKSFTRADCQRFFRDVYVPSEASLIIVGDVGVEEAFALAEKYFGKWKAPPVEHPSLASFQMPASPSILLVDKPEATQTQIRIASRGPDRRYERLIPARLSTQIFGGGFTSRLMDEIRVNRGLTYGISSYLFECEAGGLSLVSSYTKNESTRELIDVVLDLAAKYREEGPTDEELVRGQRYANGLFPLAIETVDHMARAFAELKRYDRSTDWIERYRERVLEVTTAQAKEEARRFILSEGLCIALVGSAKAIGKQVEGLGALKVIPAKKLAS